MAGRISSWVLCPGARRSPGQRRCLPLLSQPRRLLQKQQRGRTPLLPLGAPRLTPGTLRLPLGTPSLAWRRKRMNARMRQRTKLAKDESRCPKSTKNFLLLSLRNCEPKCWLATRCRCLDRRPSGFRHRIPA